MISMSQPELDRTFAALADPTRRGIIELLRKKPRRAGELADALSLNRPRMSQHLRVLRRSGLIEEDSVEHDARVRVFRLRMDPLSQLRDWLDEVERFWTAQLGAFKAHAERGNSKRK
jgi:DNA-binding transcriptional ArsR family regulator